MPALAPVVESLDKVPEAARPFYEAKDGKYSLSLDGAPAGFVPASELASANGKVVEFRDNNIKLTQEVEILRPLKTKYEGIDPDAAKDALAKVAELGKKGVKGADDLAAMVSSALDAALKPIKEQLSTSQAETVAERKRADDSAMRSHITEKFLKAGGQVKAVDFIIGLAKEAFTVEKGVVKALANKFSADRPGEALGIDEWLVGAAKDNDFAFAPSSGTGANPSRTGTPLKAGQTILMNPTPAQLGENATAISKGLVKVQYST